MKKFTFLLSVFLVLNLTNVNGQAAEAIKYSYAEGSIQFAISGKHKETTIDFGENYPVEIKDKETLITEGKKQKNGVDFMNYMSDNGWECFQNQVILSTYAIYYIYTFRKVKEE